jgi:hypothetical protein
MDSAVRSSKQEIKMSKTYAVKTEDGATNFIIASSARQARIVWERAHNEEIVSVNVCHE